jgi:hypothetical protein
MVLYGNNQTWLWDGSNWTQPASISGPTEMNNGLAMAYDAGHGQVVLIGEVEQGSGQMVMQTWEWNGTYWALMSPMNSPPAIRLRDGLRFRSRAGGLVRGLLLPIATNGGRALRRYMGVGWFQRLQFTQMSSARPACQTGE